MKTPVHWPPTTELLYRQPDGTVVKAAEADNVLADEIASEVDAVLEEAYEEALQDALEEAYEEAYEIAYEDAYRKAKKVAERKAAGQCADESEVEEAEEEAGENLRENARVNVREEAREGVGEETRDAHEEAEAHATIEQSQDDNPQPVADGIHHILRAGNCPLDIGLWREILFKLETPIELTVQQFELVWPYMTNCWSFNSNSYQYGDHFLYRCVFGAKGRGTAGYGVRAKKR
jgi:hypothetical protein